MDVGLFVIRVVVGVTLAAHGAQKLFGWFGGGGVRATGAVLESLGFVPGRWQALAAGFAEFGGGLLFAAGLASPLAASLLIAVMVVGAVSVHVKQGFFITSGGFEYTLVVGAAALAVALTGPGSLSIDHWLGIDVSGLRPGLAALALGFGGGAIQLAGRRFAAVPAGHPAK